MTQKNVSGKSDNEMVAEVIEDSLANRVLHLESEIARVIERLYNAEERLERIEGNENFRRYPLTELEG